MPAEPPLLSLCMIVRQERDLLERCLRSVCDLVDEIVVVDTGSTDGTQQTAQAHGARLIQATWENDFAAARNRSLEAARGRWILVLDADEYLLEPDKAALRALLRTHTPPDGAPPQRAFGLIQKSTSDGGRTGMLVNIIRLFPNRPEIRYTWPVHEQVALALARAQVPVENTPVVILHTGYSDPARNQDKQRRNRGILAAQIASGRDVTPQTHFLHAGCHLDLGECEAALALYCETERIARNAGDPEIAAAAVIRAAGCLAKLERFAEIVALPGDETHPEFLNLRALAAEKLGRVEDARRWRERVLDCDDRPRIPACTLAAEKTTALKALAESWFHAGRKPRAIALMRAAVALQNEGRDFTAADLARCYAE